MGEAKQEENKGESKPEGEQEQKTEEKKEEAKPAPIVLLLDLHCLGCAKKIERSILKFKGVEGVEVNMEQNQVTVKGAVDPEALCTRVQKKTMRKAKVLSPPPPSEAGSDKSQVVHSEVSGVATIEAYVNMHCEACAEHLQRKILKMKGVQSVETNLSAGKVNVTGTMSGDKLVEYIHRRTGKTASIVPPPPPKEEEKEEADQKSEDKPSEGEEKDKAPQDQDGEKKDGSGNEKGGGEEGKKEEEALTAAVTVPQEDMVKRMVHWNGGFINEEEIARRRRMMMMPWMPVPIYVIEPPPPPPTQLFSDENPNACCVS